MSFNYLSLFYVKFYIASVHKVVISKSPQVPITKGVSVKGIVNS